MLTKEVATWARRRGADKAVWTTSGILKVPKLEESITLWRTDFSKRLLPEVEKQSATNGHVGLHLRLMQDLGRARVMTASAKGQGWEVNTVDIPV